MDIQKDLHTYQRLLLNTIVNEWFGRQGTVVEDKNVKHQDGKQVQNMSNSKDRYQSMFTGGGRHTDCTSGYTRVQLEGHGVGKDSMTCGNGNGSSSLGVIGGNRNGDGINNINNTHNNTNTMTNNTNNNNLMTRNDTHNGIVSVLNRGIDAIDDDDDMGNMGNMGSDYVDSSQNINPNNGHNHRLDVDHHILGVDQHRLGGGSSNGLSIGGFSAAAVGVDGNSSYNHGFHNNGHQNMHSYYQ
jgi:hypothetical protein